MHVKWSVLAWLLAFAPIAQTPLAITRQARAVQPGELVVLTVTTLAAPHVTAFGRQLGAVQRSPDSWQVLVGIDLDVKPGRYTVQVDTGSSPDAPHATYPLVVTARKFATRQLKVDEAFVNPPASVMPRITAEAAMQQQIWNSSADVRLWGGSFIAPVPQPANSAFGTRSVFNGQPRSPHSGADFPSPTGTPILAPNAGRVRLAASLYYTGNTVIVDHGMGLMSMFAHLSAIQVREGDMVATGQTLGLVGATGRVTGPHLHWAVRLGPARIDPLSLLATLGRPLAAGAQEK